MSFEWIIVFIFILLGFSMLVLMIFDILKESIEKRLYGYVGIAIYCLIVAFAFISFLVHALLS